MISIIEIIYHLSVKISYIHTADIGGGLQSLFELPHPVNSAMGSQCHFWQPKAVLEITFGTEPKVQPKLVP